MSAVPLDRIYAGIDLDGVGGDGIGHGRGPALAIDPERNRAYVVGEGEPVAEIDLEQMEVTYHSLAEPVSLLERFHNWLEPTAEAEGVSGPFRHARWLGGAFSLFPDTTTRRTSTLQVNGTTRELRLDST